MAKSLYSLIYRSYARPPWIKQDTLNQISKQANEFNNLNDITGVLFFVDGVFIQVLEGNTVNILQLTAKIAADRRNERLRVLWHGNIKTRRFPDWAMGSFDFSDIPSDRSPLDPHALEAPGDDVVWTEKMTGDLIEFYRNNRIGGLEPMFTRMRRLT